ncbi:MAG: DUF357 domain-containing protein [Candidatus Pacearchaeota archaeon]
MSIEQNAKIEMNRMKEIMENLKINNKSKLSVHFFDFANNYLKDGIYFFNNKKFIEAFEAFVIAWAYIDAGLKLKFFKIPDKYKKYFTV